MPLAPWLLVERTCSPTRLLPASVCAKDGSLLSGWSNLSRARVSLHLWESGTKHGKKEKGKHGDTHITSNFSPLRKVNVLVHKACAICPQEAWLGLLRGSEPPPRKRWLPL